MRIKKSATFFWVLAFLSAVAAIGGFSRIGPAAPPLNAAYPKDMSVASATQDRVHPAFLGPFSSNHHKLYAPAVQNGHPTDERPVGERAPLDSDVTSPPPILSPIQEARDIGAPLDAYMMTKPMDEKASENPRDLGPSCDADAPLDWDVAHPGVFFESEIGDRLNADEPLEQAVGLEAGPELDLGDYLSADIL